jgi:predicted KAP-like P-loop ATPase
LFGHAPFANMLANAIRSYQASDGIVPALCGPWGSGKSTIREPSAKLGMKCSHEKFQQVRYR